MLNDSSRYDALGSADWRTRDDVRSLPEPRRADLELWILEQTWRFASSLAGRPHSPEDWRRALACVDRENRVRSLGPLLELGKTLRRQLNIADSSPPTTTGRSPAWMEDYLRGVAAEQLNAELSLELYRRVFAAHPDSFWAGYRAAATSFRLRNFTSAERDLRVCVAMRPANPILHSQLAACLYENDQLEEALRECESAIALDRDFEEAYRTRIFIWNRLDRHGAIDTDLARYKLLTR